MNTKQIWKYQAASCDMINIGEWQNPHAFNFTFKESVRVILPRALEYDRRPHKNLRHFHNCANRTLLSRADCRHGLRLGLAVGFEFGGKTEGLHCHGMIECPDPEALGTLPQLFEDIWTSTKSGDRQMEIKPCNGGWPEYFLKVRTKPNYADCIPWELWQEPLHLQHRA